jgi:uncharacterized membrane protein
MLKIIRSYAPEFVRLVLGIVLAAASVSKIPVFHSFAASVSLLSGIPHSASFPAAAVLIFLELGTGILLLLRRSMRVAANSAVMLFLLFACVLSAAIVRGVDTPCNCFGNFGPDLPARGQAGLDILLASLAFLLIRKNSAVEGNTNVPNPVRMLFPASALVWGIVLVIWPHPASGGRVPAPVGNIPLRDELLEPPGRPAVILLADFDDFGCQLCLDDFLAFCDSLNGGRFRSAVSVRLIARRDSTRSVSAQSRMIEGWASGNSYLFPVSVDSGAVFERSGVGKTSAIIVAADGRLLDVVHFPAGILRRNEVLQAIGG